jgi:hypothetical protein
LLLLLAKLMPGLDRAVNVPIKFTIEPTSYSRRTSWTQMLGSGR